ncbi:hypothetical protein LEP1GSC166_0538 [Leptospira kirschneri]|nr:hypothetical protein LEP1GSC166_0538 [Leptospira kirschneri]
MKIAIDKVAPVLIQKIKIYQYLRELVYTKFLILQNRISQFYLT